MLIPFTRSEKTEKDYVSRFNNLSKTIRKKLKIDKTEPISIKTIVGYVVANKPNFAISTWKIYKASVKFFIENELQKNEENKAMNEEQKNEYILALDHIKWQTQFYAKKTTNKTSGKKTKNITIYDYNLLIKETVSSKYDNYKRRNELLNWITAGLLTGLRPTEWGQAYITMRNTSLVLKVRNAKNSNMRTHGEFRTIVLDALSEEEIETIRQHVKVANKHYNDQTYDTYMKGCQTLLYKISKYVFKNKKTVSLYTFRHQFSANAKASNFSKEEIAALMGHASNDTAGVSYAKKTFGNTICRVTPIEEEVKRVRVIDKGFDRVENKFEIVSPVIDIKRQGASEVKVNYPQPEPKPQGELS